MSISIAGFIKRLVPTLSKSDLESDMDISLSALKTVMSSYEDMQSSQLAVEFKSPKAKAIVTNFYKEFDHSNSGIHLVGPKSFAADMLTLFRAIEINGLYLKKEVEDISNEIIVSKALTAFKSNVLRGVEHYFFLTRYALDLLNYLYALEAQFGGVELSKSAQPNDKQVQFIVKNLWIFSRLLPVYGQDRYKFKTKMESLSMAVINQDQMQDALDTYDHGKLDLFNNLPVGFIGSPIYTVRLIWAQWEADRYKQLKDKKKLLELRCLHLKILKEQGQADLNTERELEYLQKRVTDIDYKVAKIEESARD